MTENHCANATTNTASRADVSLLAADEFTFDSASGWRTQRASFVLWPGQAMYLGYCQLKEFA